MKSQRRWKRFVKDAARSTSSVNRRSGWAPRCRRRTVSVLTNTPPPCAIWKAACTVPRNGEDGREFVKRSGLFLDVIKLALETDSTRLVTLFVDNTVIHNSTHHGNRPEVIAELREHEEGNLNQLARFLDGLSSVQEQGQTLLDRTMVLYGTCMGSANSHSNVNLPVLPAGGGLKHGQHLAFDHEKNYPLANLYLSMLHRLGIPAKEFATSTGTMAGLEFA